MHDFIYFFTIFLKVFQYALLYVSSDTGSSAYSKRLVFHQVLTFALLALLVQKYLLTGTKVQILTPEEDQLRVTKKADVLWEINFNDLVFDDPPEVHADVC